MIGETVSHFRIEEKLGEGGMGVVYRAHDTKLDRKVALKFLTPQAGGRDADRSRFLQEARTAGGLHHQNICTIYEIGEHEGRQFIAMAFVEGESLAERIGRGPLPADEAIDIVTQVCNGLHAAHEKGIVHRDVKPANVMLEPSGRPLVMDFGLARTVDSTRLTRTGVTVGTIGYMSPEQLGGGEPDRRSDVWAVGVMLFELVTGRLPFKGDVEPALMYSIMNEDPASVSTVVPGLPPGLDGIIAKALEKKPGDRYADAAQLRADLDALRNDPSAFPRGIPRRRIRRRRLVTGLSAATIALLAIGAFIVPRFVGKSQAITSLAVLPVENLSGDAGQDVYADGMQVELITTMGKIENLTVVSRGSVRRYRDTDKTPAEIADELHVDALMEGSVRIDGDRMYVSAELVKASTGEVLWTDSFEAAVGQGPALQKTIAMAVADRIHGRLLASAREVEAREVDPEAYREYLKFIADWFSSESIPRLLRAVELDSTFGDAWAGLSHRASYSAQYGHLPQDSAFAIARHAAEKALLLEPNSPMAHTAMATVYWDQDWDGERYREEMERAAVLNPNAELVVGHEVSRLLANGKPEAGIALAEKSIAADALNPSLRQVLGWRLYNYGYFELALDQFKRNLDVFPDHYFTNMLYAATLSKLGRYEEAVAQRKKNEEMFEWLRYDADGDGKKEKGLGPAFRRGGGSWMFAVAYANTDARDELVATAENSKAAYADSMDAVDAWKTAFYLAALGENDEAREWLDVSAEAFRAEVEAGAERAALHVVYQAELYAHLGDKDLAFEWLELAFELRAAPLKDMYRKFEELWGDPRYQELMRRRGFTDDVIAYVARNG